MEKINNRVDQYKDAESTSGSQQHTGWSYWRQYCKSLILGKPLDEEATKVSPQESEATPLLDAGQKRKRTDESSSEAGQSREAGSTSGSKRPWGQSDSCQPFEAFGSGNCRDEDNNDHFKFKYLTEEYEKLKDETLGVKTRYKELIENIRSFVADKDKEQTKKLISEIFCVMQRFSVVLVWRKSNKPFARDRKPFGSGVSRHVNDSTRESGEGSS